MALHRLHLFLLLNPLKVQIFTNLFFFLVFNGLNLNVADCIGERPEPMPPIMVHYIPSVAAIDPLVGEVLTQISLNQHESVTQLDYRTSIHRLELHPGDNTVQWINLKKNYLLFLRHSLRFVYGT